MTLLRKKMTQKGKNNLHELKIMLTWYHIFRYKSAKNHNETSKYESTAQKKRREKERKNQYNQ